LGRKFDVNFAIPNLGGTSCLAVFFVALNSFGGSIEGLKLDIGVHCLASQSVHDDVDGLVPVLNEATVATQEGIDLIASGVEWNLGSVRRAFMLVYKDGNSR